MNARAPAITRALPVSDLRPDRRDPGGAQLIRDMLRADGTPGATSRGGRTLAIALSELLAAETTGMRGEASGGTAGPAAGVALGERAALAAQRGLALPAVVLEKLPGGGVRLSIGAAQVVLDLPEALSAGLQSGETVFLRPQAANTTQSRQLVPGTTAAALEAGVAPAALSAVAPPAAGAELGSTALLVSRLVSSTPAGAAGVPIATPVPLATEPGNAVQIAAGLKEALSASGLFYESHLADWVGGAGSKAGLLREPQAAFGRLAALDPRGNGAASAATAPQSATGGPLPLQAEVMIQRQLEVLEQRSAQWHGQAWPGQEAQVRIEEDEPGDGEAPQGEPTWQATLRLSMAGLGALEARVGLAGKDATLAIRAADPEGARRLRAGRAELAHALAEHGLRLANARIDDAGRA